MIAKLLANKYLTIGAAILAVLICLWGVVSYFKISALQAEIETKEVELQTAYDTNKHNLQLIDILKENDLINREYRDVLRNEMIELEKQHASQVFKIRQQIPKEDIECLNRPHPIGVNRLFRSNSN